MRVDSPPALPREGVGTPSTANSFAGEGRQEKSFKPAGLIVAGVLALAIVIGLMVWRPWAKEQPGSGAKTTNQLGSSANTPVAPRGMVYVPGGELMMGRDDGDEYERPAHKVVVKPFFMDANEVTRQQYQDFVNKTGHVAPANWTGKQFFAGAGTGR
jgi:formylglycine-generating enzyme required for sulfatase activity